MLALPDTTVPHVEWGEFSQTFQWRQGEHVTLIGATGRGKTTLELAILPRREFVIFFGTKREDATQTALVNRMGYKLTSDPRQIHSSIAPRWVLRPAFPRDASVAELKRLHAGVFRYALMMAFRQGRWTIVCDEVRYITDYLGLADECELLWLQGRSLKVTVVAGAQRPRHNPLEAYSQARHLFLWHTPDVQDVARLAQIAGVSGEQVAAIVPNLDSQRFQVLYIHPESGTMLTTTSPPPS